MRKLKELWRFLKGVLKDRTPYIVVYDTGLQVTLALVDSEEFGGRGGIFVGDWDGAYRFMQQRSKDSRYPYRIAIAGDVAELNHLFPQYR